VASIPDYCGQPGDLPVRAPVLRVTPSAAAYDVGILYRPQAGLTPVFHPQAVHRYGGSSWWRASLRSGRTIRIKWTPEPASGGDFLRVQADGPFSQSEALGLLGTAVNDLHTYREHSDSLGRLGGDLQALLGQLTCAMETTRSTLACCDSVLYRLRSPAADAGGGAAGGVPAAGAGGGAGSDVLQLAAVLADLGRAGADERRALLQLTARSLDQMARQQATAVKDHDRADLAARSARAQGSLFTAERSRLRGDLRESKSEVGRLGAEVGRLGAEVGRLTEMLTESRRQTRLVTDRQSQMRAHMCTVLGCTMRTNQHCSVHGYPGGSGGARGGGSSTEDSSSAEDPSSTDDTSSTEGTPSTDDSSSTEGTSSSSSSSDESEDEDMEEDEDEGSEAGGVGAEGRGAPAAAADAAAAAAVAAPAATVGGPAEDASELDYEL
jgi:hypothetical protein